MQPIQRPILLLSLCCALCGPWLCQAEAAECLARSLAELRDRAVVEAPESADCDGPCLVAPSSSEVSACAVDCDFPAPLAVLDLSGRLSSSLLLPAPDTGPRRHVWLPSSALRRQAHLQTFLF